MGVNISELKESKLDFNELFKAADCSQGMMIVLKGIADNQSTIKKNANLITELSNAALLLLKQVNDNQDAIFNNTKILNKISGIIIEMDKRIKTLEEKHS